MASKFINAEIKEAKELPGTGLIHVEADGISLTTDMSRFNHCRTSQNFGGFNGAAMKWVPAKDRQNEDAVHG